MNLFILFLAISALVIITFSLYYLVKFGERYDKKLDERKNQLCERFNFKIIHEKGDDSILNNFLESKLLNKKLKWILSGGLIMRGDFMKSGNQLDYLRIASYAGGISANSLSPYETPEIGCIIQKLDKRINNFYLYNKKPLHKMYKDSFDLVTNLKKIYYLYPDNLFKVVNKEVLLKLFNYCKEFMGASFEVHNGYFIILTWYPMKAYYTKGKFSLIEYESLFRKSIEIKKTIEKFS